ncbi:MAG TPA: DnaJ domain-containing protein [Longimicrobiales bacterium]|nr:DnaJ domain-containing protein [Longimicrobiales bacterium]
MSEKPWVDHYETLQLSSMADPETVERVYRLLAKRYHPDNERSGDADRFNQVRTAYEVLSHPETRAAYDANYEAERSRQWEIFEQGSADSDRDNDQRLFHGILSLLYIARRRDPMHGGMAPLHMERMLGVAREHLAFPLWYLKKRGYIEILESGLMAVTVDGIDKLGSDELSLPADRLITSRAVGDERDAGPHVLPEFSSALRDAD